ncbi:hypothetical protein, partial [Streptomyces sp. NPDC048845]|uniref:hypothetical protein n=1 Tax=Streptomyces sp. NPDC048845 TaxID=3155390 RepID=UPI00341748BF
MIRTTASGTGLRTGYTGPTGPTGRVRRSRRGRRGLVVRRMLAIALASAALPFAAGCGIRGTSVPVDAGPAPSRSSCATSGYRSPVPDSPRERSANVYLVCGSRLVPVERLLRPTGGDPDEEGLGFARALLAELQSQPTGGEAQSGFATEVPDGLRIEGAREDDPAGVLRLSADPADLPPYALAQLVCTYSATAAAGDERSVLL